MYMSEVYIVMKGMVKGKGKIAVGLIFSILLLLYWYYCFVIRGSSVTYPYSFDILLWLN